MNFKTHVDRICKILRERYPEVKTPLSHETPFQLLVASILSAQCTDQEVNRVTGELFNCLKAPSDFAQAPLKTIEKLIRPTGFFHNKDISRKVYFNLVNLSNFDKEWPLGVLKETLIIHLWYKDSTEVFREAFDGNRPTAKRRDFKPKIRV